MKKSLFTLILITIVFTECFSQTIHPGNTEIQGDLTVKGRFSTIGSLSVPIDDSGFGTSPLFGLFYFKSLDNNPLRTRMGINYSINTSNGTTQYAVKGSLKAPLIELDAQAGSISLYGENGAGADFRNPDNTLNLGLHVASNGNIGIGTADVKSNIHVSGGNGGAELLIEADKDNSNEMDNPFITLSQDGGFVNGYIGMVGLKNTAPQMEKYGRAIRDDQGEWHDRSDYVGTEDNYLLVGTNQKFGVQLGTYGEVRMTVHENGNVGIGTNEPNEKLEVNGSIRTKEITVEASPWPDYVFEDDYDLTSLDELAQFIREKSHLPNIPSAKEVEEKGVKLGKMNALFLEKIEELTLHLISQNEEIKKLKSRLEQIEER
ncbi:hypothetical protein [Ekhidna sp.]